MTGNLASPKTGCTPAKNGASEDQGRTCPEIAGMQIVFDTIKVQASRKTAVSAMPAQGKRAWHAARLDRGFDPALGLHCFSSPGPSHEPQCKPDAESKSISILLSRRWCPKR